MTIDHIETQRLRIRSFQPSDWQAVYDYTSDPDVMMYIPEGPFTPEQAKAFVADNMGEQAHFVAVLLKTDDLLVGHMEFHPWFAPQTFEIGWVFDRAYHGQGYATEAAMALLQYGFETLHLHRIIATCQPENVASCRVVENWACDEKPTFESASGVRIMGGGTNTSMLFWKESGSRLLRDE